MDNLLSVFIHQNGNGTFELAAYGHNDSAPMFVATVKDQWHLKGLVEALSVGRMVALGAHSQKLLNG